MSDVIPGMRASMDPVVGLATTTTAATGSAERPEAGTFAALLEQALVPDANAAQRALAPTLASALPLATGTAEPTPTGAQATGTARAATSAADVRSASQTSESISPAASPTTGTSASSDPGENEEVSIDGETATADARTEIVAEPATAFPGASAADIAATTSRAIADVIAATGRGPSAGRAAASSAAANSSPGIERSTADLSPEFRVRLERVVERMEAEFGYKVEIVETVRSQSRQEQLFAQGRTASGPVVTWTRASKHTQGRAADVVIDGRYDDPTAYARLGEIARAEGLRTLGARDPGHLELPAAPGATTSAIARAAVPASASTKSPQASHAAPRGVLLAAAAPVPPAENAADAASSRAHAAPRAAQAPAVSSVTSFAQHSAVATVASVASVAQPARVADVAPVAQVAQVAQVATVARVATPGESNVAQSSATRTGTVASAASDAAATQLTVAPSESRAGGDRQSGAGDDGRPRGDEAEASAALAESTHTAPQTDGTHARPLAERRADALGGSTRAEQVAHADMTERVARVLQAQDAAAERPLSQVLLRLDRPDGGEDRIRVDLRGNTIGTTMDFTDRTAVEQLSGHVGELQRALERHGLDTETVSIRAVARATDSVTLSQAAIAAAERDVPRASSGASTHGGDARERGSQERAPHGRPGGDPARDDPRRDADSHRQRPRRGQRGDA